MYRWQKTKKYLYVWVIILSAGLGVNIANASDIDLTPDVAAPVPPPGDPNPPVANNEPNDAAIQIAVRSRLPSFTDTVKIQVQRGMVYLTGFVETDAQFVDVVARSYTAPGVVGVKSSELGIKYSEKARSDLQITARAKGALMVMDVLDKDMSSWPIQIETKAGRVYISGKVITETVRGNILRVIQCLPDIGPVHSTLQVGA